MSGKKPTRFAGRFVLIPAVVGLLIAAQSYGQGTTTVVVPGRAAAVQSDWPGVEKSVPIVYPGEGEVTADNVLVRSGGNLNYYVCGRLSAGGKVVVRDVQYGWLKIDPPKECFSLIAADYVKKTGGANEGVVTGTAVRVRAGAIDSDKNSAIQCQLNTGDIVEILDEVKSELFGSKQRFYKIVPPEGKAFLWVSGKYVRYIRPYKKAAEGEQTIVDLELREPAEALPPSADRRELENLDKALISEMRRPIAERELAEHLAKYLSLRAKTTSSAIGELAKNRVTEIRRHMEVQMVLEESVKIRKDYESSQKRMQELYRTFGKVSGKTEEKLVRRTGLLRRSYVFRSQGVKRWRLVEPATGKNLCYLMPGAVSAEVLKSEEGKTVTVSGTAVFDLRVRLYLVVVNKMQAEGE